MGTVRQLIALLFICVNGYSQEYTFITQSPQGKAILNRYDSVTLITFDGQSNAMGVKNASLLPADSSNRVSNVFIYGDRLENVYCSTGNCNFPKQPAPYFSVETNLANLLEQYSDRKYLFVKYALGSTSLNTDPNNWDWNVNSNEELYYRYVLLIDRAIASMNNSVRIKRIIRVKFQGESDYGDTTLFKTNETALIEAFNAHYSNYEVRHILVRINDQRPLGVYWPIMTLAATRADTDYLDIDSVPIDGADSPHYTAQGYLDLGRLLYNKLVSLNLIP